MNCIKCRSELPDGALYCPKCGKKQVQEKRKALKRANGTGTVYKLSGRRTKPWVAAKNRVIIGYYERKTDALEALDHLAGRSLSERYNMTFAEVYADWKREHFPSISKSSQTSYEVSFSAFSSLHKLKFRDLRTKDFQEELDKYQGKSYSTLSKHKFLLNQMSMWAMREEICTSNFARFVKLPENTKKEKTIFTDSDIQLLAQDGSEAAMIVLMLIYTGMRINELFTLPLEDYHGTYVVGGEKTSAGKDRTIPIMPAGRKYFEYFARHATGDLLLSGYVGQKVAANFRNRDYYPLLEKLGIEKRPPHSTRHTFTSRAVKSGVQPEMLQKILGHADYSTTANVYTHIDAETLVRAVENC